MTIKLSDTQHGAIVEVSETGRSAAKSNTLKSLESKGLIEPVTWIEDMPHLDYKLTDAGREYLGLPELEADDTNFHKKLMESVAELESALQGDPWKMGEQITADEPCLEFPSEPVIDLDSTITQVVTFDKNCALWERELCGFGATIGWNNTEVWHGLTAEEIREDLDTRVPANRADKRMHAKAYRKAFKQLANAL